MRLIHFVNIISQKCMSSADVWKYRTQFWVTKTVWQRIPNRRARHRKAPTTETVQLIARYDQLPLSGKTQMLTASDFCCECTTVNQVRRSSSMETSIHEHCELKSYSIGDIKPMELTCISRDKPRPATHRDHRTVLVKQLRHYVTVQYSKVVRRLVAELLNVWEQLWSSQVTCKHIFLVSFQCSTTDWLRRIDQSPHTNRKTGERMVRDEAANIYIRNVSVGSGDDEV